jgi:PhoPQ-activated pathogenicity-related protein
MRFFTTLRFLLGALANATPARADLDAYLRKPEPAYHWSLVSTTKEDGATVYDIRMTSQTWQGIEWKHRLQLFVPDNVVFPHFCGLYNTGGDGGEGDTLLGMSAAKMSGAPFAILFGIPNQPLYDGRTEDALVVYTWLKFMETGDESWPLHFPMAKAVLKAIDTLQALAHKEKLPSLDGFMVCGASKRGWTTWLAGASRDRRIKAIAPMVIDTLNLPAQTPHQLAVYGGHLSEQVDDYTRAGVIEKLATPEGKRLIALEDPYSYRDRLALPKLLILGTNDRYWAQDALNFYWDDLKGPKWVLYDPNSGHGLEDRVRVLNTLTAFIRSIAGHTPWPQMHWSYTDENGGVTLAVGSDLKPISARLFRVFAPTQDFRDSKWTSEEMSPAGDHWAGHLDAPDTGFAATFGEVTYELDGKAFTLSTQIRIVKGKN